MRAVIPVFFMTAVTAICGHCSNIHSHSKPSVQTRCDVVKRKGLCIFNDQFKQFVTGNIKRLNRKCCSDGDALEKAYIVTKNGEKIVKTFNGYFKPMEFDTCALKGETFCPKCCKVAVCNPNPCENGGTCSPTDNSYSCNCPTGFWGKLCEVAVCNPNPGENGATCSPTDNGYSLNPCDVYNPCLNNGTCIPSDGGVSCRCPPNFPGINCKKVDCNFDENYCAWKQMFNDNFYWLRKKGKTPTGETGPFNDHTGDGSYIFIEASWRNQFDKARIESPDVIPSTTTQCLSFWYHMYGGDMGDLNVYIKKNATGLGDAVWTRSGNQRDVWKQGYVNLSQIPFPYSIVFEGVRGPGYESDMAIDDITLVEGDCPGA